MHQGHWSVLCSQLCVMPGRQVQRERDRMHASSNCLKLDSFFELPQAKWPCNSTLAQASERRDLDIAQGLSLNVWS